MRRADLLHDHVFLAFQLFRVKFGAVENVGENIDGQRHVIAQDAGIEGCCFNTGGGVDLAAYILDIGGYFPGGAMFRSLEGHMFQKMGNTVLIARLVT
jgi:hypothetical protein